MLFKSCSNAILLFVVYAEFLFVLRLKSVQVGVAQIEQLSGLVQFVPRLIRE